MKRCGLVLAASLSACFAEPPTADPVGSSGAGSTSGTTSGTTGGSAESASPSVTDDSADTSTNSTGTTVGSDSLGDSSSGGDTTGPPPAPTFCESREGPNVIACRDFESRSPEGWAPYPVEGFTRTEDAMVPAAHSAPHFARLVRDDNPAGAEPVQALFGHDFAPGELAGVSVGMEVRYPANFGEFCGAEPIRLYEIRFGETGAFTNIVVEAGPNQLIVYYFSPTQNGEIGRYNVMNPAPAGGWYHFDFDLIFGGAGQKSGFSVMGDIAGPAPQVAVAFAPAGQELTVNAGPWFEAAEAPATGCSYHLDDLILESIDGL